MGHTRKMRSAYNICLNSDQLSQQEDDDIHFFIAVRAIIYKMTKGSAPDAAQMNRKVSAMIKEALISQEVEEITKVGVKQEKEIDLLSEEYMERLKRIQLPNTKVKLMERLLRQVIDNLKKVNKTRGVDFTKRLNAIIEKYNDRSDNTTLANEVIDEVVKQMAELLKEVNAEKKSGDELGISFEEKAFFDILKSVAVKYDFYDNLSTVDSKFNDEKLVSLTKEIKLIVDDKSQYTDWAQRTDIKAELKVAVIVALAKAKYPPFTNDEVFKEILEQAENFKKNAPATPRKLENVEDDCDVRNLIFNRLHMDADITDADLQREVIELYGERYPDMSLNDWRHIIEAYTPMVREASQSVAKEVSMMPEQLGMAAEPSGEFNDDKE